MLLDEAFQPAELPLRYVMEELYLHDTWRSIRNRLHPIGLLYRYFEGKGVTVDERLRAGAVFTSNELIAFFSWLEIKDRERNDTYSIVVDQIGIETLNNYIGYLADYAAWATKHYFQKPDLEAVEQKGEAVKKAFITHRRHGTSKKRVRGLPEDRVHQLLTILQPCHSENPFRPSKQFANAVLIRFLLETGVRLGECQSIRTSDMVLWGNDPSVTVQARNPDGRETRRRAPAVKTLDRILPISLALAKDLSVYERKVRGRVSHPYFFITPRDHLPITDVNVERLFRRLDSALGFKVRPHLLRHTYFESILREGSKQLKHLTPEQQEITLQNHMKYLGGWTLKSVMPAKYAHGEIERQARSIARKNIESLYQ